MFFGTQCRSKHSIDEIFCINTNSVITDPNLIANKFNYFFANIGYNLAKNISPSFKNFKDFLPLKLIQILLSLNQQII